MLSIWSKGITLSPGKRLVRLRFDSKQVNIMNLKKAKSRPTHFAQSDVV